ncbi:MAG: heparinase II/III family protein, partial [Armatimonadota bacterium]
DYLSEADRKKAIQHMSARGGQMYHHLRHRRDHIWKPYESHANRAWHYLGEVATAFYGDIEGAGDWLWFAMNVFYNSYPVWNDSEGGWHEGTLYWAGYMGRVVAWLATMKPTFGINGYKKPFFSKIGDFPMYVIPPGETMGGFGDHAAGYRASRIRGKMTVFARSARNPYWQWVATAAGGEELPGGYIGFIYGTLPPIEPKPPTDIPQSKLFPGIGLAVLHTDLVNRFQDIQFMMKASPMGSQSHGYESQNSFLLSVAGKPVFIRTGYRDLYGSPHHQNWMWETKSVNCILVNGEGQKKHCNDPLGEISDFHTSEGFDYVVGQAGEAYKNPIDRFTRAVLFIKPDAVVMFDTLQTPEAATYQWLLHAPNKMQIRDGLIRAENEEGAAIAQIRARQELQISQTNKFDPPPEDFVDLTQWHLTAETTTPSDTMDFVTVIRPYRSRRPTPPTGFEPYMPPGADVLGCTVELEDGQATVVWRKSGDDAYTYNGVTADADIACVVRRHDGSVKEIFVHNGSVIGCD